MKCPVCNAEAAKGATFCQHCGAKLPLVEGGAATTTSTAEKAPTRPAPQASTAEKSALDPSATGRRRGIVDVPEETLWEGTYSPKAMVGTYLFCALASVALVVVAFLLPPGIGRWIALAAVPLVWVAAAIRLAMQRLGISYKLTNQMFYHRSGVLTRTTDRIELIEIHDVTWEQGLVQRLVNVGSIVITSSDRTTPHFRATGIENVEAVSQMIDKARRGEQVRRGRRIDFSQIDGET
jgi:membrane protein YdbS with pleckstrin-like domain